MKIKFKRPCFVSGTYYEPFVVHEIPAEAFPKKIMPNGQEKDGWPEDAVVLPDDVPVENKSTTPKQAPGTKDDQGRRIGSQGFEAKGAEPQQNAEVQPSPDVNMPVGQPIRVPGAPPVPGKPELNVKPTIPVVPIPDEFGDDMAADFGKPSPSAKSTTKADTKGKGKIEI